MTNLVFHHELIATNFIVAGLIAVGNTLEAIIIATLLKKFFGFSRDFSTLTDVLGFVAATMVGTSVGATIGITTLYFLRGTLSVPQATMGWTTWWLGDMLGLLVVTPILVTSAPKDALKAVKSKIFTGFTYPLFLTLLAALTLTGLVPTSIRQYFMGFLAYSALIWCALAFSMRGLFIAVGLASCAAIFRAYNGLGLFGSVPDMVQRLSLLQLLLGTIAITMMVLRAVVAEKLTARELVYSRELSLLAAEKMSTLGAMTATVAHEINNPLSVIYTRTEQLREMAKSGSVDVKELDQVAEKIELTAVRIERIVRSLNFYSRNGENDAFRPAYLKAIINDTVEICSQQFKAKNIRLIIDPVSQEFQLDCRAVQIAQVLLNLLNNAQHAAAREPERWVRLSAQCRSHTVELSVTDSGAGIAPELIEKIFQPFFTTKSAGEGTGLGLSVSKDIVEAHHGSIALDVNGPNTRFVVQLPQRQVL